jgi:hypothetical protein
MYYFLYEHKVDLSLVVRRNTLNLGIKFLSKYLPNLGVTLVSL